MERIVVVLKNGQKISWVGSGQKNIEEWINKNQDQIKYVDKIDQNNPWKKVKLKTKKV